MPRRLWGDNRSRPPGVHAGTPHQLFLVTSRVKWTIKCRQEIGAPLLEKGVLIDMDLRPIEAALLMACVCLTNAHLAHAELQILDKPLWIFPGQQVRVVLQQPAGSGKLSVQVPATLEMFDTWDQDSIQRYYFRALHAGDATLRFSGAAGELEMPLEVVAWGDVYRPRRYKDIALPRIWPMEELEYGELKSERTMHSEADLERLREQGKVTPRAARWRDTPDDEIYNIIPGPSVPRTFGTVLATDLEPNRGIGKGCPVCGTAIFEGRSGFYPWKYSTDPLDWKIRCPNCNTEFPSNDWRGGDMHSGPFPDDGFGCEPVEPVIAPDGGKWRWPFIAYYHQHAAYMSEFTPGIIETAEAYAATGDAAYAHKSAIGLLRFAEAMVDMSLNLNHRKQAIRGVHGGPVGAPRESRFHPFNRSWSYIESNWDYLRMQNAARAWDLILDSLDDDEELLEFARRNGHPEIQSIADFRHFVETGILRVPIQMAIDDALERNWPGQELTAIRLALCLGTERATEVADWALNEARAGVRFSLTNLFYKDGAAHESPGYNRNHIRGITEVCRALDDLMQLYPDICQPPRFVSPARDPKFRRIFDFALESSLIGRNTPYVGDSGKGGHADVLPLGQGWPLQLDSWIAAYRATGDPRFAQAMYGPEGSLATGIGNPELKRIAEQAGEESGWQVELPSNILDGYGFAILRSGQDDDQRALWMHYTRITKHNHVDMLTYGLAGLKRELLPELGYPEGWGHAWAGSWGTHYQTKITGVPGNDFNRGELTTFVGDPPVQVAAAESFAMLGDQKCTRQRTMALVDLSPGQFYVVTVERVQGGQEHTFSFHGPHGEAVAENVEMQPYAGTALGEGLKYGDAAAAAERDRELACLAYMHDPARGKPAGVWSVNCSLGGQDDTYLRMTSVYPEGGELVLARGHNPQGRRLYEMPWVILTSQGEPPLTRQYLNVIEPYEGEAAIKNIERVAVSGGDPEAQFEPLALRVTSDQFVDTIILQHRAGPLLSADGISFDGGFGFWRERDGELVMATLVRGTRLVKDGSGVTMDTAEYNGRVVSCDWAGRSLVISPAPPDVAALPGRHIRITNPHGSSASYQVESAEAVADGCRIAFTLDPRVGEGFVKECRDGVLVSDTFLRLHPFRYYAGKTLANETGDALYRISDVSDGYNCPIIADEGADLSAATLEAKFGDLNGDGLKHFLIYDYGPGDLVTLENFATVERRNERVLLLNHSGGADQVTIVVEQP